MQNRQRRQTISNGAPAAVFYRRPVLFDDQTITPLPYSFETREIGGPEGEPRHIHNWETPGTANHSHFQCNHHICSESTSTSSEAAKRTKVVTSATAARVIATINKYNVEGVDLIPAGDRLFGGTWTEVNNKISSGGEFWEVCPPQHPQEPVVDASHYLQVRNVGISWKEDPQGSFDTKCLQM